ncbi:hypothetical protein GCM10011613_24060 [Cellvibrio zantedeschiae]|uniref:Cytochrome oxidase complex assembly protein 1 n=2 Tax=Cellvibrio zantedeschiae TaxID=1237077 RepID=A0ABQ3B7D3_9GAMM|nr:hypothetical protein GCM10011613_24060 [Cellvibrio zantedeschiae]
MESHKEYVSGLGKESKIPPEIKGWNWGAFFLNWIWGIGNNTYIAFLMFIPFVNFIMIFILGAKGNEWAWQNKKWKDVNHFKSVQRKWLLASLGIIGVFFPLLFLSVSSALKGEAYDQSLSIIRENQQVIEMVGKPIEPGYFILGSISTQGPNGQASLEYNISGPKASAVVYVYANKHAGTWNLEQVVVNDEENHKKINVIPREN